MAAAKKSTLTIMFADIAQSTRLYEVHGDDKAQQIVSNILGWLIGTTERNRGRVIKMIGDEIMCTFNVSDDAVQAACEMHQLIKRETMKAPMNIALRVGLHHGEVICDDNDIYGDAVIVAARMVGIAKADEIITTRETVMSLPFEVRSKTRYLNKTKVHGKQASIDIFDVIWTANSNSVTSAGMAFSQHTDDFTAHKQITRSSLLLLHDKKRFVVNEQHPFLTLGRGIDNDMIICKSWISRRHAKIEMRNGNFVLSDYSRYGTAVLSDSGSEYFAHRDEIHLQGQGMLIFKGSDKNVEIVHFEVDSQGRMV